MHVCLCVCVCVCVCVFVSVCCFNNAPVGHRSPCGRRKAPAAVNDTGALGAHCVECVYRWVRKGCDTV